MSATDLIGIEIGGTKLQAVLGDSQGSISETLEVAADAEGGAEAILRQLEPMARQLIASCDGRVCGMGIGFGGPVNSATGVVIKSNHVAGWENVSLTDWTQQLFHLPSAVGNDTDVAAIAEARIGAGRHDCCVFYTNIGSGIGGGLVVDGQLYARPEGAMEIGHQLVYSEFDGRHGILEEFCSGWSLNHRAREAAERDEASLLWENAGGKKEAIDAAALFDAWEQGDAAATRVVECFLDCYGRTLANMIALLNPDVVIIGGGVAQRGKTLLEAIRQSTTRFVYKPFADAYRIELTTLGKQAVPAGALLLAGELVGPENA